MDDNNLTQWLMKHAYKLMCPSCRGLNVCPKMADHVVRCHSYCGRCKRHWMYVIDVELKVSERKTRWWYLKLDKMNEKNKSYMER